MQKGWFVDWFNSPYYHKLYSHRDEQEAKDFIERLIDQLKPAAGSRMLDVACGRGRHSCVLVEKGFDVIGIDLSVNNIKYAKKFEKENLEFFVHDMRLPFWINYFDYAFNFFTSFGYFRTKREHDDAMRTIVNSLKKGGQLVIDYLNVHYTEKCLVPEEIKKIGHTTYNILRWQDEYHFFKKMIIKDEALSKPLEFTEVVAKFSLSDFTDMLSYFGMQVKNVFGNYKLSDYDPYNTPRLIIIAEKIKE